MLAIEVVMCLQVPCTTSMYVSTTTADFRYLDPDGEQQNWLNYLAGQIKQHTEKT